jgi:hypothetical protein
MGTMGRRQILHCLPFVNHGVPEFRLIVGSQSTGIEDEQRCSSRSLPTQRNRIGAVALVDQFAAIVEIPASQRGEGVLVQNPSTALGMRA